MWLLLGLATVVNLHAHVHGIPCEVRPLPSVPPFGGRAIVTTARTDSDAIAALGFLWRLQQLNESTPRGVLTTYQTSEVVRGQLGLLGTMIEADDVLPSLDFCARGLQLPMASRVLLVSPLVRLDTLPNAAVWGSDWCVREKGQLLAASFEPWRDELSKNFEALHRRGDSQAFYTLICPAEKTLEDVLPGSEVVPKLPALQDELACAPGGNATVEFLTAVATANVSTFSHAQDGLSGRHPPALIQPLLLFKEAPSQQLEPLPPATERLSVTSRSASRAVEVSGDAFVRFDQDQLGRAALVDAVTQDVAGWFAVRAGAVTVRALAFNDVGMSAEITVEHPEASPTLLSTKLAAVDRKAWVATAAIYTEFTGQAFNAPPSTSTPGPTPAPFRGKRADEVSLEPAGSMAPTRRPGDDTDVEIPATTQNQALLAELDAEFKMLDNAQR